MTPSLPGGARALAAALLVLAPTGAAAQVAPPDHHVVIVGGGTSLPAVSRSALPNSRHWVVLAGLSSSGAPSAISATACAQTGVRFSLDVPEKVGLAAPEAPSQTVTVPRSTVDSVGTAWGRTTDRIPWDAIAVAGSSPADPLYCVAYTTALRLDASAAEQIVTARVDRGATRTPQSGDEIRLADGSRGGSVYEFPGRRLDSVSSGLVIVGRSVEDSYGYVSTQMKGTYAVLLGAIDPETGAIGAAGVGACTAGKVRFSLLAPKDPGLTPLWTEVSPVWVDSREAERLFHQTLRRDRCDGGCSGGERGRAVASQAARHDALGSPDWGRPPFFCVAQAPVVLTSNVGRQQVLADVVRTGGIPDVRLVEALRQPTGSSGLAGDTPGGQAAFDPIRAHARPRPMVGLMASNEELSRTGPADATEGEAAEAEGWKTVAFAGFDFAIEPVLSPVLEALQIDMSGRPWARFGRLQRALQRMRLTVGTNIAGELGDAVYLGVSVPSLSSLAATSSPIDGSVGVTIRRDDDRPLVTAALSIDLGGALGALKGVLGI